MDTISEVPREPSHRRWRELGHLSRPRYSRAVDALDLGVLILVPRYGLQRCARRAWDVNKDSDSVVKVLSVRVHVYPLSTPFQVRFTLGRQKGESSAPALNPSDTTYYLPPKIPSHVG